MKIKLIESRINTMIFFKKYMVTFSVAIASSVFAQKTLQQKQLPKLYDNQVTTEATSVVAEPEKNLLTPKELVDINLNDIMDDPVLKNAHWGFVVYDPKTQKIVSSYNETDAFVPASTTKLLTTETALHLLGENYRWSTQLEYSGEIDENGTLNGNLYIVGSGDPSLGTGKAGAATYGQIINDFIYALKEEKGIKKINGDLFIQNAIFKDNKGMQLPENIVWMDFNNYYLPVGTTQDIDPRNEKLISKSNNPFNNSKSYFYVSPYINKVVYADTYTSKDFTTTVAVAPYYLANALRKNMLKQGLPISGSVHAKMADQTPEPRTFVTVYKSPTLQEIVRDTNKRSDNALAEALLKTVGFFKKGDQTKESGREVVVEHLTRSGFDLNGLNYYDGSGLSRSNTVTPIAQVKFLTSLMKTDYYNEFYDSLPIGGQDGTLKRMFLETGNGQVRAKTGTLRGVKTLAGYVTTNSGRTLVFSLLVNNYSGSVAQVKQRMEKILTPVYDL